MSKLTQEQKDVLDELADADKLDADALLEASRDPSHPCHSRFEWDDEEAAHQYRLGQAHQTIALYHIWVASESGTVKMRKHSFVASQGRYMDGDEALFNFRDEMEATMRRDVKTLVLKHRRLGLESIVGAVQAAWG